MNDAVAAEKVFAHELLANGMAHFSIEQLQGFVVYLADCRLRSCGLLAPGPSKVNPIPDLPGLLHVRKKSSVHTRQVLRPCLNDGDL